MAESVVFSPTIRAVRTRLASNPDPLAPSPDLFWESTIGFGTRGKSGLFNNLGEGKRIVKSSARVPPRVSAAVDGVDYTA
jgi:hypothetical protein